MTTMEADADNEEANQNAIIDGHPEPTETPANKQNATSELNVNSDAREGPDNAVVPSDWQNALQQISTASNGTIPTVTFICGHKNCGKSTFSRLCMNRLLEGGSDVAYIESDLGQPEFTPSGVISLHYIKSSEIPIAGRPHLHLRKPNLAYYVGDTSPKLNPSVFLAAVTRCIQEYNSKWRQQSIPLVINTHGWVVGMGHNLLEAIIHAAHPTHLVQIQSYEKRHLSCLPTELPCESLVFNIEPVKGVHALPRKPADYSRFCSFASYFLNDPKERYSGVGDVLSAMCPYVIPISHVTLALAGSGGTLNRDAPKLAAFNASLVGLCCSKKNEQLKVGSSSQDDANSGIEFHGDQLDIPICIGLGIIRGIDQDRGLMYILTPVPEDELSLVDVLELGNQRLQLEYMYEDPRLLHTSPYLTFDSVDGAPTSKRNPKRKRLAK